MEEQMIKMIASIVMMLKVVIPTIAILLAIQGLAYQLSGKRINIYKSLVKYVGG